MNAKKSKRQKTRSQPITQTKKERSSNATEQGQTSGKALRETVESIVIAFVLAFLFRAFEAEAFVIPTGSMAPTLFGRHKDVHCPECNFNYQASASQESADNGRRGLTVERCVCPMCGYTMTVAERPIGKNKTQLLEPSYNGDRILVSKFAYELRDPERWDVIVFRYPGNAKMNYIKRLVGLPNEIIRIQNGDIFVAPRLPENKHDSEFVIARKPPDRLLATLQLVHDNQHLSQSLIDVGWPIRWQTTNGDSDKASGHWGSEVVKSKHHARQTWTIDGTNKDETRWIRYRHFLPTQTDWNRILTNQPVTIPERPRLIADSYAYNTSEPPAIFPRRGPLNWMGDLAVECDLQVADEAGQLMLELTEGGFTFNCAIDLSTGKATLSINAGAISFDSDEAQEQNLFPVAQTQAKGSGAYQIMLSNIDDELRLWVDGTLAVFDQKTTYPQLSNNRNTESDLSPVAIGARHAQINIRDIRIWRDVYYIEYNKDRVTNSTPRYEMAAGQFFVLGDNSPQSKDGRLWDRPPDNANHYVEREQLIGKALFIYWPHARSDIFPFCPNIPRMGFVR